MDRSAMEMSAETKIPAAIAYTLSWGSPRSDGITITTSFFCRKRFQTCVSTRITPPNHENSLIYSPLPTSPEPGALTEIRRGVYPAQSQSFSSS
ncbi:MAG: hypothetical protein LBG27_10560 [Spirochaetaceae bacterium]|nr:hypothetical protein [Spirochaetaceae bacterium]